MSIAEGLEFESLLCPPLPPLCACSRGYNVGPGNLCVFLSSTDALFLSRGSGGFGAYRGRQTLRSADDGERHHLFLSHVPPQSFRLPRRHHWYALPVFLFYHAFTTLTTSLSVKETYVSAKETYVSVKETYASVKETYASLSHCHLIKVIILLMRTTLSLPVYHACEIAST